jgi:phospholipase/carboxylesterase
MAIKTSSELFHCVYQDNGAARTLVLLHGTGGTEHDLLGIVASLKSSYNFLGLRGNVQENGMNRFFARLGDGVFDKVSIDKEVKKLKKFLGLWGKEHFVKPEDMRYLGFSNGANMILALAFQHPELVQKAVLLHPMLPYQPEQELDLAGKQFLVSYGETDPMVSAAKSKQLIKALEKWGAIVKAVSHPGEHRVVRVEVEQALEFLKDE